MMPRFINSIYTCQVSPRRCCEVELTFSKLFDRSCLRTKCGLNRGQLTSKLAKRGLASISIPPLQHTQRISFASNTSIDDVKLEVTFLLLRYW